VTFISINIPNGCLGHNYMLRDDIPLPGTLKLTVLSDKEAEDAITMIKESKAKRPGESRYLHSPRLLCVFT
jgi:hypothetical protein